jgi:acyl-CoA thioester hydrolase
MQTRTKIETRYPECDRMGIVHHAVYPIWYEMARMDWFIAAGLSFETMNAYGVNPAMVDLHIQYIASASYPQTLYISTRPGKYAPKKLELLYEIYTEDNKLISSASTFHIWTGPDNKSYNLEENLPDIYNKIKTAAD